MTVWTGKLEGDGKLNFGEHNAINIRKFGKEHPGTPVRLDTAVNPVSAEMRGYYFGAFLPFLRKLIPEWKDATNDELHEILKTEFNSFEAYNPFSKQKEKFGQSIMSNDRQNKKAMEFIMRIADWVSTNYQQTMPDPELYKKFRDSAPHLTDES